MVFILKLISLWISLLISCLFDWPTNSGILEIELLSRVQQGCHLISRPLHPSGMPAFCDEMRGWMELWGHPVWWRHTTSIYSSPITLLFWFSCVEMDVNYLEEVVTISVWKMQQTQYKLLVSRPRRRVMHASEASWAFKVHAYIGKPYSALLGPTLVVKMV